MGYASGGKTSAGMSMNKFGVMLPNNRAPGGANTISPVNSPSTAPIPWYESGAFWTAAFLFVGYIAVYRTLR
jgi:hypothetical protein